MRYKDVSNSLKSFSPPADWPGHLFMLPEEAVRDIYHFIIKNRLRSCIELGTCFGTTACAMAAAVEEIGGGRVVAVDKHLHQPINPKVIINHIGLAENAIEIVIDELGYNWYLADLIRKQSHCGVVCKPIFDFCLLDGAHEWECDALAFYLVAKLLKPGGWIAIDDINFNSRMMFPEEEHNKYTDRELDAFQLRMVYELAVRQHPDFCDFHTTHGGRIGWARKRPRILKRILRPR
ncbi:MAG: class I SAM-dependent methyltransferase [Candidatus Tritonobacter lacicola]|nr:class I SAM-dependent methyltransferase [Candidatus Tritonobacter lacicola]